VFKVFPGNGGVEEVFFYGVPLLVFMVGPQEFQSPWGEKSQFLKDYHLISNLSTVAQTHLLKEVFFSFLLLFSLLSSKSLATTKMCQRQKLPLIGCQHLKTAIFNNFLKSPFFQVFFWRPLAGLGAADMHVGFPRLPLQPPLPSFSSLSFLPPPPTN
jgi:hypothetical protein